MYTVLGARLSVNASLGTGFSKMHTDDGEGYELPFRPEIMAKAKLT
tara:strand:- start:5139 stop:5276 length:138 start_codon:yes stop_codon:yes gene_type:complete